MTDYKLVPVEPSRESSMVVLECDEYGKPAVWCDPEIADLVSALNGSGVRTIASCSGHGKRPGNIVLADGRELVIARSFEESRIVDSIFPGINGEPARSVVVPKTAVQGEPSLVAWVLYDATADQKYIKASDDGALAIFDSEAAARRARTMHPGTDYKRCEYYSAPKPAEQHPPLQLPDFVTDPDDSDEGASLWDHGYKRGWNACLEAATDIVQPAEQQPAPDVPDYEQVLDGQRRLTRELDVLLNGEEGAAQQASLADLVAQLRTVVRNTGKPVLAAPDVAGLVSAAEFLLHRLREMEDLLVDDELCRNYLGHVAPAIARFEGLVAAHRLKEPSHDNQ